MNLTEQEEIFQEDLYRFNNRVMIVLSEPWSNLTEENTTLLSKILASVKLLIDGVQVVEASTVDLDVLQKFNPEYILAFGARSSNEQEKYKPIVENNVHMLFADRIADLNDERKKMLWGGLKAMFHV